jgi:hypothetical protein
MVHQDIPMMQVWGLAVEKSLGKMWRYRGGRKIMQGTSVEAIQPTMGA